MDTVAYSAKDVQSSVMDSHEEKQHTKTTCNDGSVNVNFHPVSPYEYIVIRKSVSPSKQENT